MCSSEAIDRILHRVAGFANSVFSEGGCETVLYGSCARGDYDNESDIDIMVIADISPEALPRCRRAFAALTSELGLENDVVITVTLKDRASFEHYLHAVPFYQAVRREGISFAG